MKARCLKIWNLKKLRWRTLWTSLPVSTSLVFPRLPSVFPNELDLVSLALCHILNQGYKLLKRHLSFVNKNKTLFDTVSTGFDMRFLSWLFIKKSLMRSEFWQLQSQWNWTSCYNLGTCSSMWLVCEKKNIIFNMANFGKNCWENESYKTKVFNYSVALF